MTEVVEWLLHGDEPWTRWRTRLDLLGEDESAPQAQAARSEMLAHPQIQALISSAASWGDRPLKRHNDASHPIYVLSTLADFGLRADDPGMGEILERVLSHQSPEGAFLTPVFIPKAFGGPDKELWTWIACDAPVLLYVLLVMGSQDDPRVQDAVVHLTGLAEENGYRCAAHADLGRFHGPGRRDDPCPMANLCALKALAVAPGEADSPAARLATEMLLRHWQEQHERKYYLFGIGGDFRKLKYPYIWYDILHVCEALSRIPYASADPRLEEMMAAIHAQADNRGRYTASSMYQTWKGWSFADKKAPSPWLTFLALRMQRRYLQID